MPTSTTAPRGFTLIEVMIVLAVLAILSAIAFPSYQAYVARARRADARASLLQAAQYMQRFYAANDRFDVDRSGNDPLSQMPEGFKVSPSQGSALYQLNPAITGAGSYTATVSATAYTLTMAPIAGRTMAADACGIYTLNSVGIKNNISAGGVALSTAQRDACWK